MWRTLKVTTFQRTYAARLIDGKYQILDRLGIGGMGEIFKVRHIHLNELRVIKIMRPNVAADDQGMQRFLQEARTSTTIKDKNLAMLYDFAQLDDGSYYMVWEFIDGTNIQKWIFQNGPMPPRLTVEISVQALHGLDHLHSMGLIHRDISPEDIVMRSLEKGRDQRFATAAEFATALEAVRNTIPPDQKYGLGERMVTLSGAKTISDLPKYKTGQAATMGSAPTQMTTGASGTASAKTQADQATVIERTGAPPQRQTRGSNEPTIQERLPTQSAPTVVESKWTGEAQPTVLERQITTKKKPNVMMMSGIAATVVIGIIVAALVLQQPGKKDGGVNPPPPPTSGSDVDVGHPA